MRARGGARYIFFLCNILILWIAGSSFIGKPNPDLKKRKPSVFFTTVYDTVVVCGTSTTLHTDAIPTYSNPKWNDGSTGNTLTVTTSGDYWWEETGPNIVTNGNFSAGNTGFSSDYTYEPYIPGNTNQLVPEKTYSVYTDPSKLHYMFSQFGDHTTGTGNMLIVNGAPQPGVSVWRQTITVLPNTDYIFSVWATSATPTNPAVLQFSVGSGAGSALGTINLSPTISDGVWQNFSTVWNSGSTSGTVSIGLINQNTIADGNDFAVDDIVFAPTYRKNTHVVINPIPVLAVTPAHTACGTYDLTQAITGYDPATYTYFFKDSSGNTVTNPVTQSGVYTITEQNKTTGCTSLPKTTTITIQPAPPKPGITSM